ncbi:MAG TPA: hypothetical protein VNG71_08180, partial [Pyrinomonadaceae bacterium]|nr:hypothetical protein [Pyrinomonadaceae bacterium]
ARKRKSRIFIDSSSNLTQLMLKPPTRTKNLPSLTSQGTEIEVQPTIEHIRVAHWLVTIVATNDSLSI